MFFTKNAYENCVLFWKTTSYHFYVACFQMHTFRNGKHFCRFGVIFLFLNLFGFKQQLFTVFFRKEPPFYYYYYYLPHNWSWFATTRSSPPAAPPEGGTWTCVLSRDTSSMRQNSFSQKAIPTFWNRILFGLQRHDPHLWRLRQRGVLGSAFRRETQAACDGTAFYKKLYQRLFLVNTVGGWRGGRWEAKIVTDHVV